MGDLISEVLRNALLQIYTPDQLRGRVSSLYLAQVTTAPALGNVEAGGVARLVSPVFSVVSGGLACVAGALVLGALIPALRNATLAGPAGELGGGATAGVGGLSRLTRSRLTCVGLLTGPETGGSPHDPEAFACK